MYDKVTFSGEQRLILVEPLVYSLDVKADIYSAWKFWVTQGDNTKFLPALRTVGGDPLVGGQYLGATFFLTNGWRIRTWEGNHTLSVVGNLYTEEGTSPFVQTLGNWNVLIELIKSNLVDSLEVPALSTQERDKLMSLDNFDLTQIVNSIWDSPVPAGVTIKEFITDKLLTVNKFIGLQ